MTEEVEVHVKQLDDQPASQDSPPIAEGLRRLLLASIGALALTYEEAEKVVNKLVDRGELAQRDGEKVMNQMMDRFRQRPEEVEDQVMEVESKLENGLDQFLNRLNIPSKRDIDDLSAKVAQLAARVEELRRDQATVPNAPPPTTPRPTKGKTA